MRVESSANYAVDIEVKNNYLKTIKDPETDIETVIKDNSSYHVQLSQEALDKLLASSKFDKIIPKEKEELIVYNSKGELGGIRK